MVDCFAAGHERANHLEDSPWETLHRMEPPPADHPFDGALAQAVRGPADPSLRRWATCVERPMLKWGHTVAAKLSTADAPKKELV